MQVVGVTREWSTKDLLGHLAHWEQGAAEQVRELQAGTCSPRKRTLEEAEQIKPGGDGRRPCDAGPQLRQQFSRARTEIVSALRDAPEEMDETFPLARIVRSQCVRHRGHHLTQLRAWGRAFAKWVIVRNEFGTDHFAAKRARRPGGR